MHAGAIARGSGLLLGLVLVVACGDASRFEARAWREADLTTRDRAGMASALVRSDRLKGLDRQAVIRLLGPPTPTPVGRTAGRRLIYLLGPERGLIVIDQAWLMIELDDQGPVRAARVLED